MTPAVARHLRTQTGRARTMALTADDERRPGKRRLVYSSRGNDGTLWMLAADLTVKDANPIVHWHTLKGAAHQSPPFASVADARSWLQASLLRLSGETSD